MSGMRGHYAHGSRPPGPQNHQQWGSAPGRASMGSGRGGYGRGYGRGRNRMHSGNYSMHQPMDRWAPPAGAPHHWTPRGGGRGRFRGSHNPRGGFRGGSRSSRPPNRDQSQEKSRDRSRDTSRENSRDRSRSPPRRKRRRRRSRSPESGDSDEARRIHAQLLGGNVSSDDDKPAKDEKAAEDKDDENNDENKDGDGEEFNFEEYEKMPVRVRGPNKQVNPIAEWKDCSIIPAKLIENLKRNKIVRPSPVQKHAIPMIIAGQDIMASAQTGSGKTLAFLIPLLARILSGGVEIRPFFAGKFAKAGPLALILGPTRELVQQIQKECEKLLPDTGLQSFAAFGGNNYSEQKLALQEKQTDILAATPGRLQDLFKDGRVSLEFVKYLVFDEADKMLDMGFEKAIQEIITTLDLPAKDTRQTVMFSATYPPKIQKMAEAYLREYNRLVVGHVGSTVENIDQIVKLVEDYKKNSMLLQDLERVPGRTIVFVQRRASADAVRDFLMVNGETAVSLHGQHEQSEREESMRAFKKKEARVLVATGVAARGLDIAGIKHVVQYDMARDMDEYTHKIGRTGRAGQKGTATTYFNPRGNGGHLASKLARYLRDAKKIVPDWLDAMTRGRGRRDRHYNRGRDRDYRDRDRRRDRRRR